MIIIPCPTDHIDVISRRNGQSCMAHCAYCSGQKMYSEYDGQWKVPNSDPARVQMVEVMLPPNAPREYADPETLWNAVDAAENSCVAQTARKMYIALPIELTREQNLALVRDYCQHEFVDKGMVCNFFFHDSGDGNPHVHLMLTLRAMDENGKWLPKTKTGFVLDENGNRIRGANRKWERYRADTVDWNDQKYGEIWRHDWETFQNVHLEKAGRPERIDMRSLARQGITDRLPGKHLGPAAAAMERKGIMTEVGNENRRILSINSLLASLRRTITGIADWIEQLKKNIESLKKINEPEQYSLADVIIGYINLRKAGRQHLSKYAQDKYSLADWQDALNAISFLKKNEITSVKMLGERLNETSKRVYELKKQTGAIDSRIRDIDALKQAFANIKELGHLETELKGIRFQGKRDKFTREHADELSKLKKAVWLRDKLIAKLSITESVSTKKLDAEQKLLEQEKENLRPELESIQSDLEEMKKVRYWTRKVFPDALPNVIDGKRSFEEEKESYENRRELDQIIDSAMDAITQSNFTSEKAIPITTPKEQTKQ